MNAAANPTPVAQRYLLDTNVVSETANARPDENVHAWLNAQPLGSLFLAAISLGELQFGVERMPAGRRRSALEIWLERRIGVDFDGRILSFDADCAMIWGRMMRKSELASGDRNEIDMQIAATALRHGLVLATRNTKDFETLGIQIIDPWTAGSPSF
jgi:predicted nucleic acid-binding protein